MEANPMREIRIDKVTLNIGCGDDKARIEKAKRLLEMLTGGKPVITRSKRRSTFGVIKDKPIGVKVTLRRKPAEDFMVKSIGALEKKLRMGQIDTDGNLNIGIKEYIDLPGVKYAHEVGMLGLGVCVTLERPGYRIKRRRIQQKIIPRSHKLTQEEVAGWLSKKYGVNIVQ
ncbi:MAG: 50S ribosomal protein L5 [Candidatus Aenigmarchaeota archaeon]|nr:50S ribosomal protein L5 [Candidatus Aenigmarchaeota archaeon]